MCLLATALAGAAVLRAWAWLGGGVALVWAQACVVRAVVRHLTVGDEGGVRALMPGRSVAGALAVAQGLVAGPVLLALLLLLFLLGEIGPVSTLLSIPLLLPVVLWCAAWGVRALPAAGAAALGLSQPVADSFARTEGHVWFMAGALALGLAPLAAVAGGFFWLAPAGLTVLRAGVAAVLVVAASAVLAGLIVGFYQRWQTVLRPDMRPSRNRARRLEPVLDALAGRSAWRRAAGRNDR